MKESIQMGSKTILVAEAEQYILDLLLSVINVSVQTVDIVASLPHLKFD